MTTWDTELSDLLQDRDDISNALQISEHQYKFRTQTSECYVIPTEVKNNEFRGKFHFDEGVYSARLALEYTRGMIGTEYATIGDDGKCTSTPIKENMVPLRLRSFAEDIVGIEGPQGIKPVVFAFDTNNGTVGMYLRFDSNTRPAPYFLTGADFSPYIRNLHTAHKRNTNRSYSILNQDVGGNLEEKFDRFVIGQEDAKETLLIMMKRYQAYLASRNSDQPVKKPNTLIVGPSGSGKTRLMEVIRDHVSHLPISMAKVGSRTAQGYIGQNLHTVFQDIYDKSKSRSPTGIVFLDEIDKLALQRNGFGDNIQNEVMGWCDGDSVKLSDGYMNTDHILFVAAGAFVDKQPTLRNIVQPTGRSMSEVVHEDLVQYGLHTEFVARFPMLTATQSLSEDDFLRILRDDYLTPFSDYKSILFAEGYELDIADDLLEHLAKNAVSEANARGLNLIVDRLMKKIVLHPEEHTRDGIIRLNRFSLKHVGKGVQR